MKKFILVIILMVSIFLTGCVSDPETYFELFAEVKVAPSEIKELLAEMVEEGYITMNYSWKNEHDEYPYSLTEKGLKAWEKLQL